MIAHQLSVVRANTRRIVHLLEGQKSSVSATHNCDNNALDRRTVLAAVVKAVGPQLPHCATDLYRVSIGAALKSTESIRSQSKSEREESKLINKIVYSFQNFQTKLFNAARHKKGPSNAHRLKHSSEFKINPKVCLSLLKSPNKTDSLLDLI